MRWAAAPTIGERKALEMRESISRRCSLPLFSLFACPRPVKIIPHQLLDQFNPLVHGSLDGSAQPHDRLFFRAERQRLTANHAKPGTHFAQGSRQLENLRGMQTMHLERTAVDE